MALALASPAYPGPIEDRIRRIESRWRPSDLMAAAKVPAVSIAVLRDAQVEWARAYGVAVTTSSLFQAASISKPVAAMAALHMAQHGNFALDQDVNEKLQSWRIPENDFTKTSKVTISRILSHTAGLTVHGFPGYGEGEERPSVLEILDGRMPANTAPVRVDVEPGTRYRYSGGGYTVLQVLLEDRFRKPFAELMRRIVLQPLSLGTSTFEQPLPDELASRAAVAFHETGRSYTGGWHTYPEQAAAGLWTTPIDLLKFGIEVHKARSGMSNRVLEKDMAVRMTTPAAGAPEHGLGFAANREWFWHNGANAGYRCALFMSIDGRHGAAVMTNSDTGQKVIRPVLSAIAAESGWPAGPF